MYLKMEQKLRETFHLKKRESRKEKERQAGRKEGKSDRVTLCLKCSLALRTKFKAVLTSFTQKGAGVGSEDGGAGPPASWVLAPHLSAPRGPGPAHHGLGSGAAENPHASDHLRLLQARPPNPLGVSESWTSRLRQHLAQLPAPVVQGSDYSRRTEGSALQVARHGDRGRARTRYRNSDGKGGTQLPQEREVRPGHLSASSHDQRDRLVLLEGMKTRRDLPSRDHRLTGCSGKASPSFPAGKRVRSLNRHSVGFFPAQHRPPLSTAARGPGPRKLLGAHTEKFGGKVTRRITLAWMTLIPCQDNHELSASV